MPRVPFDDSERQGNPFDYPKLKLQMRERARINVIEPEPVVAFRHVLKAPEIVGGKVVMEMRSVSRDSDEKIPVPKQQFIGQPLCLGEYDVVKNKGRDAENCPVCALTEQSDAVRPPERRFAIHVIKYGVREGTWDAQTPMSVALFAWVFPGRTYDKLVSIKNEWGNLQEHDLKLGPCENAEFQKFDIEAAKDAVWRSTDDNIKLVRELVKNNRNPDLETMLGRKPSREDLERDIQRVLQRAKQAAAASTSEATGGAAETVTSEGITADVADLLGDVTADAPETSDAPSLIEDDTPAPAPSNGETKTLDDLLAEIEPPA